MYMIKDRNSMDLIEAEEIKKKWQECTETYTKKSSMIQISMDGVVTYLEPDILECEVKWALGSITRNKASGGDRNPTELFQILKDDAVKVLHAVCQWIWKIKPQTGKGQFSFQSPKRAMPNKACSNNHRIVFISHAIKVMLKILQARLQQHVIQEILDVQAGFRKGRGTRDQIANISQTTKSKRIPEKHPLLLHWLC